MGASLASVLRGARHYFLFSFSDFSFLRGQRCSLSTIGVLSPCLSVSVSHPLSPSFLPPSIPLCLYFNLSLSLCLLPLFFSPLSLTCSFIFFFFYRHNYLLYYQGGEGDCGKEKRKQFLPRKENVTACYFRSWSFFLSSLLPQLILYAAFLSQNQSMYPGKHMSSKVGKGSISGISYLQNHFHICKETVSLQLNFLGAIW